MKRKHLLPIILLLPLLATSCQQNSVSDSTGDSTSASDSTSDSTSSGGESFDLNDALATLTADTIVFSGDLSFDFYYAETTTLYQHEENEQITAFNTNYYYGYYNELIVPETGSSYYYTYDGSIFNENGYAASKVLLPNNTVVTQILVDGDENSLFSDYENPFLDLNLSNLSLTDEGVELINLTDEQKAFIGYQLIWFSNVPFTSLVFTIENGELTGGKFLGEEKNITVESSTGGLPLIVDSVITYDFKFIDISETNFRMPEPFESKSSDPALDALFDKLALGNYTMDMTRESDGIGATNFSYKCYYQEDLIVRYTRDLSSGVSGVGIYNPNSATSSVGYVDVSYGEDANGNAILSGTGTEYPTYLIFDRVAGFDFSPAVFDYDSTTSTYTLKSGYGFGRYISVTAPDAYWNASNFLANYVDGSLKIKIGSNNDATFTYDYSATDAYGYTTNGTITLDIYDIGTTNLEFTYEEYVAPDYSTWAGYGEEGVEIIKTFLGENALDFFPVIDNNMSRFTPYQIRYDSADNSDTPFGWFMALYSSSDAAAEAQAAYAAKLLAAGWVAMDESNEYFKYELSDGSGYYSVRVFAMTTSFYFNLFQITPTAVNALDAFLIDNFWKGTNCTLTQTKRIQYYKYNSSTSEYEYYSTSSEENTSRRTIIYDGWKASSKTNSSTLTDYFTSDRNNHSYVSYYQSNLDDNGATMILQGTRNYKTIKDYAIGSGSLIHPLALRSYAGYFTQSTTDLNRFDVANADVAFNIYATLDGMSSSSQTYAKEQGYTYSGYATLGSETINGEISPTLEIVFSQTRITENEWKYVDEIVLTINNIGNSSVTLPEIYVEESA